MTLSPCEACSGHAEHLTESVQHECAHCGAPVWTTCPRQFLCVSCGIASDFRRGKRLVEQGYRRGWREACEALAASVDDHALAERLAELWRGEE